MKLIIIHEDVFLSTTLILIQLLERKRGTKDANITRVHDRNIRNLTDSEPTTTTTSTTTTTTTTTLKVLDRKKRNNFTYHNILH